MIVNGQNVLTPRDDAAGFVLDWRHKVALAATTSPTTGIPFVLANDTELQRYAAHIRRRAKVPLRHGEALTVHDRVVGWRDQQTGRIVEAYLLTPASLQEITAEIGLDAADIKLYGQLFFDVRKPDGSLNRNVVVRLRSEMSHEPNEDGYLKHAALLGGLPLLRKINRSVADDRPDDLLTALVEQELARRLVTGQLENRDLAKLQANGLIRERIRSEGADTLSSRMEGWMYTLKLLGAIAPRMVRREQTAATNASTTAEIQARLRAQRNVQNTPVIADEDRGHQAIDELLRRHFKTPPGAHDLHPDTPHSDTSSNP